jgi:hypothetical protein
MHQWIGIVIGKKRRYEGSSMALFSLSQRNEASLEAEETHV